MFNYRNVLKKVLSAKGFLYLSTRFGGSKIRRMALDGFYDSGQWDYFEVTHSDNIIETVAEYSKGGKILDMGCGPGIVSELLPDDSYSDYLGIDASQSAIDRAMVRSSDKAQFKVSAFQDVDLGNLCFDVILFEESIYYLPSAYSDYCQKIKKHLSSEGVFVVTIADPERYKTLIHSLCSNFNIIENRLLSKDGKRLLLVFR